MKSELKLQGTKGSQLVVRQWQGEGPVIGALHILHGMAEHCDRYSEFAAYMVAQGFVVWSHDHRQHGYSVHHDQYGFYNEGDTWAGMIEDVKVVQKAFREAYKDVPMTMLGHSMGSLVLRDYVQSVTTDLAGVVVMGSPTNPKALLVVGKMIAALLSKVNKTKASPFLNNLSVGKFNKSIVAPNTPFDWISQDPDMVEGYANDPMCGYAYNPSFYKELSIGALRADDRTSMSRFPNIPTLFISGDQDPAGEFGKGVKKLSETYSQLGLSPTLKIMTNMRHEVLNEKQREETYKVVGDFLVRCLSIQ